MYGFVVHRNAFDEILIPWPLKIVESWKRQVLEKAGIMFMSVTWKGVAPCGAIEFISKSSNFDSR